MLTYRRQTTDDMPSHKLVWPLASTAKNEFDYLYVFFKIYLLTFFYSDSSPKSNTGDPYRLSFEKNVQLACGRSVSLPKSFLNAFIRGGLNNVPARITVLY